MIKKESIKERKNNILSFINKNYKASVNELALKFDVTEVTIRRDLLSLEEDGKLIRTHGGAISNRDKAVWQTTSIKSRMEKFSENKRKIAKALASKIDNGTSIFLDGGSTALFLTNELKEKKSLLVVTNCPSIAETLAGINDNKVILAGGELYSETDLTLGPTCENNLKLYRTDIAVIGVSGILLNEGIFSSIPQECAAKKIMIQNASKVYVIADSSKIERTAFSFIEDFTNIDILFTDDEITKDQIAKLKDKGVSVVVV
ncbi:MAG: DeoR/GlpR family DNA-binding transcription regulator [Sphaerochaetaceae bacterium]